MGTMVSQWDRMPLPADAAFTVGKPRFGHVTTGSKIALGTKTAANGGPVDGIIEGYADAAGKALNLVGTGKYEIELGATLAAGAEVMAQHSDGRAIAAAATVGTYVPGFIIDGGVAGNIVEFKFRPRVVAA